MNAVYFDSALKDDARRQCLFDGGLFVFSPCSKAQALRQLAHELCVEAFAPYDPKTAQFELPVEEYAAVLEKLKPRFIHHPKAKECIQGLLQELGCDLSKVYFDVPRLRTSTSNSYLTTGIAYAFHPHRDTWYSAPQCQLNWWLPVYEITPDNGLAFHPHYWNTPLKNGSRHYNYYRWNAESRKNAAKHIKTDPRIQPKPEEPVELDPQVRLISPPGGITVFSAAHLHSSVPNTSGYTRFSIDFRTVHFDDVKNQNGAPNLDSECTGTTMRDYLRGTDFSRLPESLVAMYDTESPAHGVLVYQPDELVSAKN